MIAPYPMPSAAEITPGRPDWRPDWSRAALLIHDMQEHFLAVFDRNAAPIPALIANIARLHAAATGAGAPVIFSAQPADQRPAQRGLLQAVWGDGIPAGRNAEKIIDSLPLAPDDIHLVKWRYSAAVRTDLLARLAAMGRDQLVICGVYAHIGCIMSACHVFMEDVEPVLVADAMADFSAEDHREALGWAARTCAVVVDTADLVQAADGASAGGITLERLRADIVAVVEDPPEHLGDEDDLIDLGLDSLRLIGLVESWRADGHEVAVEDLIEADPTLIGWWAVVGRGQGARSG